MTSKLKSVLLLLLPSLLFTPSCSTERSREIAELAVTRFHSQFNAGEYQEIYAQADQEFHKAATELDFADFLKTVHRKLGNVQRTEQTGFRVSTELGVRTLVSLTYNTTFARGAGDEQFIWAIKGGQSILFRYDINSADLVITKLLIVAPNEHAKLNSITTNGQS